MLTKEDVLQCKYMERPTVRCKYACTYVDQDGRRTKGERETTGKIDIDGNNPWVTIWAAGSHIAERFSWSLVLAVLNDKYEPPIYFGAVPEYEV